MAQYWDCSLDNYFYVPDSMTGDVIHGTDIRAPPSLPTTGVAHAHAHAQSNGKIYGADGTSRSTAAADTPPSAACLTEPEQSPPPPGMKCVYTGQRVGTGSAMPEAFRDETLRGFVEAAAWNFNCQVVVSQHPPRLAAGKLLLPVRQSMMVGRTPKDRSEARRGRVEGPVLLVQARPPRAEGETEAIDLVREVGGMLLGAQERDREGCEEKAQGEGKWWTCTPRWGGGSGGPMGWEADWERKQKEREKARKEKGDEGGGGEKARAEEGGSKKRPLSEEVVVRIMGDANGKLEMGGPVDRDLPRTAKGPPPRHGSKDGKEIAPRGSRRNPTAERWKAIKPGPSLWDRRLKYMKIGKLSRADHGDDVAEASHDGCGRREKEQGAASFDDVFMVSSINHHIALLRMRVSEAYLAWLAGPDPAAAAAAAAAAEGKGDEGQKKGPVGEQPPPPPPLDGEHAVLTVWRTRWFDLFSQDDRAQAMEGLWMILACLLRETRSA